eukprot:COSAG05_NODE_4135_length_1658_cov_1.563182_1_plen_273_part_00
MSLPPPVLDAPVIEPGIEDTAASAHFTPRDQPKRDRDDSDSDSSEEGTHTSDTMRRMAKRHRSEGPLSEVVPLHQDPARNLMTAARAATVAHTMAMKMESKLGCTSSVGSSGSHGCGASSAELDGSRRWARSPSPTPSVMSGCSVAGNAPASPTSCASDMSHIRAFLDETEQIGSGAAGTGAGGGMPHAPESAGSEEWPDGLSADDDQRHGDEQIGDRGGGCGGARRASSDQKPPAHIHEPLQPPPSGHGGDEGGAAAVVAPPPIVDPFDLG